MRIIYSDQEIDELVNEVKYLPDNWHEVLMDKERLIVRGINGNDFIIIFRPPATPDDNFSVGLGLCIKSIRPPFLLRRYNGEGNTHTNYIEGNEVGIFHVHYTTEKYQHLSQKNEHYAEETDRYTDVHGALQCLIQDANFRQSPSF